MRPRFCRTTGDRVIACDDCGGRFKGLYVSYESEYDWETFCIKCEVRAFFRELVRSTKFKVRKAELTVRWTITLTVHTAIQYGIREAFKHRKEFVRVAKDIAVVHIRYRLSGRA